jgi:hypothetical protein
MEGTTEEWKFLVGRRRRRRRRRRTSRKRNMIVAEC